MNRLITRLTSLRGLIRPKDRAGQIATLMIVLLVAALVFVLATVNIGNVAVESTALANAADATALQLASGLASQAKQLWDGLGGRWEKCKKRGWMSLILGGLGAVLGVIISCVFFGCATVPIFIGAIIGGTVGGMSGAAIDGTSILQGAITGFKIGVAIAGIASGVTHGFGEIGYMKGSSFVLEQTVWIPTTMDQALIASGALAIASEIYMKIANDQALSELYSKFARDINALNDPKDPALRFREQAFSMAFNYPGVMDDPNKVADSEDIDGDGNRTEFVPAFLSLWRRRLQHIKEKQHEIYQDGGIVDWFQRRMYDFTLTYNNTLEGLLKRQEYRLQVLSGAPDDFEDDTIKVIAGNGDSRIVEVLRALYTAASPGPYYTWTTDSPAEVIYRTGPDFPAMKQWFESEEDCEEPPCEGNEEDCDACAESVCDSDVPPAGYDQYDELADDLVERVGLMKVLGDPETNLEESGSWLNLFYNMDNDDLSPGEICEMNKSEPYYDTLAKQTALLAQLKSEIKRIRDNELPECIIETRCLKYDEDGITCIEEEKYVTNPPCRFKPEDGNGAPEPGRGSINEDLNDEFLPVVRDDTGDIDQVRNDLNTFRNDIQALGGLAEGEVPPELGGKNPATYCWSDTRGRSCVEVEVGPVIVPYMHHCKHKKGPRILYYSGPYPGGKYAGKDRCWVRITKTSPSLFSLGSLGRWNPFNRPLTKVSVARYNHFKSNKFEVWLHKTTDLVGVKQKKKK